jgi:uncharacterized membrane protein
MPVDVETEIEIDRPRDEVASYVADPENAPVWYENIESVEWKTAPALAVGSRVAFVARFLGRRLSYTYELRELVPGERLVMSTSEGPFPMETTYTWADSGSGGTRMTLRNRGEPAGFSKVAVPVLASAIRRANRKDLERLKAILESSQANLGSLAQPARVAEPRELGDVAPEEERGRPVGDDAELSHQERQLDEVVRAGDEPCRKAAQPQAEHVGDALVPAERRHLTEHPVRVRLRLADQVLG